MPNVRCLDTRAAPAYPDLRNAPQTVRQQLQRSEARNAALQRQLNQLRRAERTRLAQLVHDDLGQYLVAIRAQLAVLALVGEAPMQPNVAALAQNCQALQEGFRRVLDGLPDEPERLQPMLQALASRWQRDHGLRCVLHVPFSLPALRPEAVRAIRLLLQEALTNVARHAVASQVRLRLRWHGGRLMFVLSDNGRGGAGDSAGLGLQSMMRRASELGGELRIARRQRRGWTLLLCLPVENHP